MLNGSVLREAGVDADAETETPSSARALVLLDTNDVHNVHAALTARALDPSLRIVIQLVNPRLGARLGSNRDAEDNLDGADPRLGKRLKRRLRRTRAHPPTPELVGGLLGDCVVISGPSLAAPAFVADALEEDELTWLELGGRRGLVAGPADLIRSPHVTVLADATSSATPELLPDHSENPHG